MLRLLNARKLGFVSIADLSGADASRVRVESDTALPFSVDYSVRDRSGFWAAPP